MKSIKEIESTLKENKSNLFERYPIESLTIFGSFARNEQHEQSDLDLMVEFNEKIGIRFIDLAEEIEKLIGFKVDLVSKKGINRKHLQAIQSDLIYV